MDWHWEACLFYILNFLFLFVYGTLLFILFFMSCAFDSIFLRGAFEISLNLALEAYYIVGRLPSDLLMTVNAEFRGYAFGALYFVWVIWRCTCLTARQVINV